ncbi:sulfotransferase family protein [Sandaracinus amylolyticus]|uniref:sulfotransferase family protein n=1 Tax=Sandaracinus amylolyticus TaxID=927083 RepID=UPI001F47CA83|nr:sulfotransferase [Sandaracinus amylolyticus]UJR80839.1 Sulfotransferase [Sandaracinus amylolyticus]
MGEREKVVFIGGAGHSGSTLLGLMLGAHPQVFYAGEARKSLFLGDESKPLKKRVCKLCGPSCPIWGELGRAPGEDLYATLVRRTGRRIVVDSTKNLSWLDEQLETLGHRDVDRHLVFLARDGRAVVCSRLRKYPERSAREHAEDWAAQIRATEALVARFPGTVLRLRYEALASAPEPTMREVASFLGIDYVPAMIAPWTTEQHPLGGNNGTQFLMRGTEGGVVALTDKTRDHYGAHPRGIVLDLRWKRELGDDARAAFDEVAGDLNRAYAWDGET